MNAIPLNEAELIEVLQIAQDGETKLKVMSDHATSLAEKWKVKANKSKENFTLKNTEVQFQFNLELVSDQV